jgi:hypothetical protein
MWFVSGTQGSRSRDSGKFKSQLVLGQVKSAGSEYRGWTYEFISHQTGASVKRMLFSVSILDENGHRAAYLRDFANVDQATRAAREWIDRTESRRRYAKPLRHPLGSVPTLPAANQEPPQEK